MTPRELVFFAFPNVFGCLLLTEERARSLLFWQSPDRPKTPAA